VPPPRTQQLRIVNRTIASFKVQALVALLDGLKLAVSMTVGTGAKPSVG
jgi:hypothetical protein